jgi:cell division protein FtsB
MNTIDAASLARWIVITAFVAVTGLIYVYLSVQLNRLGDQKKKLENELASLRVQSTDMSSQVANLTSRPALERRLKEGYLKLIPIQERYLVRFTPLPDRAGENEIQPVANQRR